MQIEKNRSFLLPIIVLSILSVVVVAFILTYININLSKSYLDQQIEKKTQEYIKHKKQTIEYEVHRRDRVIRFNNGRVEKRLKELLTERVELAHKIATNIYKENKGKLSDQKIKQKIIEHIQEIKYQNGRVFYFISDYKTNRVLSHAIPKFIGKDMTNFQDKRGVRLLPLRNEAVKNGDVGFFQVYFDKPGDHTANEYPKLNAAKLFKPYNMVIGMGEYLDVIEKETKKHSIEKFSNENRYLNQDEHIFVMDLHNINGGENFATLLLNPINDKHEGMLISDTYIDANGTLVAKEMLKQLRKNNEAYLEYFIKDSKGKVYKKYGYFLLQKDWNWIIGSGFDYNVLENEIKRMKQLLKKQNEQLILQAIIWSIVISFIIILIALWISFNINQLIKTYIKQINSYHEEIEKQSVLISEQSKLVAMGEMIGNISHQWRQPLSVITTAASGLKLQKENNLLTDEKLYQACDYINDNAQYLSDTIDDFKNFIKGDKEKVSFSLSQVLKSFLHLVEGSTKSNDIKVIVELHDDIILEGYPNELTQCFINIYNNAKDALNALQTDRYLFISATIKNNKLEIQFKDNAGGIPEDIIDRIFEPYFTTKHRSQGTGLGLHMTYNLLTQSMKGTITAQNVSYDYTGKTYKGANIIITLPLKVD